MKTRSRPIVLVLSGGGMRGLAHVGAWKALAELRIRPDLILGTSIGGFVGAAIACGLSVRRLEEVAGGVARKDIVALDRRALWVRGVLRPSLFHGHVLRYTVSRVLPWRSFMELPIPLQINAVNLTRGRTEWFGDAGGAGAASRPSHVDASAADTVFRNVPLVDAVCASCALPPYFPPVKIGADYYVDGGVLDAFTIARAAELGAEWVIGVDVTGGPLPGDLPGQEAVAAGAEGASADDDGEAPGAEGAAEVAEDLDAGVAAAASGAAGTVGSGIIAPGLAGSDPTAGGMLAISQRAFGIIAANRREEALREWQSADVRLTHIRPRVANVPSFAFDRNHFLIERGYRATMEALEPVASEQKAG